MAMFPLGSVLFPTMVLPLHIFEERYRSLVRDCLDGDREFGVCLIERGHEVGGDDVRTAVGTVAQIIDAHQYDDGRWALACVGTRRIRVDRWLDDAPYPRADVHDLVDAEPEVDLSEAREKTVATLRRVLALHAELGDQVPPATSELSSDPTLASYQIAALSPLGSWDRQQVLAATSVPERYALLATHLAAADEVLQLRLQS